MRRTSLSVAVLLAGLFAAGVATAEPVGSYFYVAPFGGFTIFDKDYKFPGATNLTDDLHIGGRLGYRFTNWVALEAAGGFTPTAEDVTGGRDVDFAHVSGDLALSALGGQWGAPFLLLGGGVGGYKLSSGGSRDGQGHASVGLGMNVWLTDVVGLRLEGRDLMWLPRDDVANPRTHTLVFGGGLTFALGAKGRDTDGDGVSDRKDTCPGTPLGAVVDDAGCPLDTDQDGVFDGLDQCDETPAGAVVDAKGCPIDSDRDGVFDGLDKCADTPDSARVDKDGCPIDSDGDGVFDGLDKCPGTPAGAVVDANGCPTDGDGDGVFDGLDKCPDSSPGLRVDKDGCPIEIIERETELLDTGMIRLSGVQFETAKADLLPESQAPLDIVGQVLSRWPELRIEIGGHTDARGSAAYNQKLSEERVQSVLDYLSEKFPDISGQFEAKGYGETKPIASNNTEEGMARNRRVEFVVLNKDVLRRESERRRLLRLDERAPADTTAPAPADTTSN